MAGLITLKSIDKLSPGKTQWDDGKGAVTGFGARRQGKAGDRSAVSFVIKYRFRGRQRFYTIGRLGAPWTPETARKRASDLLHQAVHGTDPAEVKAAGLAEPTLSEFWTDTYLPHSEIKKKPSSRELDRLNFENHLKPAFGNVKLSAITPAMVGKFHRGRRDYPTSGNHCIRLLRNMINVAALPSYGILPRNHPNPCADIELFPEQPRERMLSALEIGQLGEALDRAERGWTPEEVAALPKAEQPERTNPEDWRAIAAIRLLLLTGARRNEILSLQWAWVDMERGVARLPDSKTGAKTIVLPAPALEVLAALPRLKSSDHVLPGDRKGSHFIGVGHPWRRIRKLAKLPDLRLHDLRHAYASLAVANNESLYLVGAVLGHRQSTTTEKYSHLSVDPVKALADRNAARIAAMLHGKPSAEVVNIATKKKL